MKDNRSVRKSRKVNKLTSERILEVPFIPQINSNACGAAVLEMIYNYYGLKDISQKKLFKKYQELEPHGSGNYRFSTNALLLDARQKGFSSFWGRADYVDIENSIGLLKIFINDLHIPVIVCQKFTEEQPMIGHFRIVLGINNRSIYLHDPNKSIGGAFKKWNIKKFLEFWQPTGNNVTGGVFVVIKK